MSMILGSLPCTDGTVTWALRTHSSGLVQAFPGFPTCDRMCELADRTGKQTFPVKDKHISHMPDEPPQTEPESEGASRAAED